MGTDIPLRRSQWFYDDAGYYSYVLLNGPEDLLKSIEQILKGKGLRVLLSGKSYRPASNGVRYQWYIRVSDETGKHPSRERVQSILAPYEIEEEELADRVRDLEGQIRKLKASLDEEKLRSQTLAKRCQSLSKQNQELQANLGKAQARIQDDRQTISNLELRLRQIQETALKPEDVAQLRQDYEGTIQALRQELESKEKELSSWIHNFDPEIQERDRRIIDLESQVRDLRNELAIKEEEKRQLIEQMHETQERQEARAEKGDTERLFSDMLSLLFPNVEFLGGSVDTLWREIQDPIRLLRELKRLPEMKAKRVQGAKEWLELRIEGDWRLYFRQCEDSHYQMLISHKNTQKVDIDWLRDQKPC